jgi:predicted negative regulator of RcsB-dependent stress response
MVRISVMSIFLFSLLVVARLANAQQDYIDQLIRLTELSDNQQYREAINGYKRLESQPGAPDWLKAGAEYEIAELYGELNEIDNAIAALNNAVQLGFDDCLTPRASKRLATISKTPKATQVLAAMKITEGDFRELVWLKSEVEHAEHDARMMITDNINRVDQQSTEIPQAELPTRPTHSAGVLYWRQQLLLIQRAQRQFVKKSDEERMVHAATMGVINGASQSAVLESARLARASAESRKAEIRKRAFVPVTTTSAVAKPCSEWR